MTWIEFCENLTITFNDSQMRPQFLLIALISIICSFPALSQEEEKDPNKIGLHLSVGALAGIPQGQFARDFPRESLWGFNFDAVVSPIQKHHWWKTGAQVEFFFTGTKKDTWKGLELKTKSSFVRVNFLNRIQLSHTGLVDPFLEFGLGFNVSTTTSSYQVFDEATFLEEFLLRVEDEWETVQVKSFNDVTSNMAVGFGVIIKRIVVVKVKYDRSPQIEFVPKDGISVFNDQIQYEAKKSKMQMISISLAVGFQE